MTNVIESARHGFFICLTCTIGQFLLVWLLTFGIISFYQLLVSYFSYFCKLCIEFFPDDKIQGTKVVLILLERIHMIFRVVKISRQPAHFTGYSEYCAGYSDS